MKMSQLIVEDYIQYKLPSLFIGTTKCFKNCPDCQNARLRHTGADVPNDQIIQEYLSNPLTKAIVFGGLDPMDTFDEVMEFCKEFRMSSKDPIVIYTGYSYDQIADRVKMLWELGGKLIVKFGAYIPGHKPHFDEVLGVNLASDNQYAEEFE